MKISFIKTRNDKNSYKMAKNFAMDVFEIQEPEQIDEKIEELKIKNYNTIIITNELASFSQNLIPKYKNDSKINIVITPTINE